MCIGSGVGGAKVEVGELDSDGEGGAKTGKLVTCSVRETNEGYTHKSGMFSLVGMSGAFEGKSACGTDAWWLYCLRLREEGPAMGLC